jgi:hypothetical protein
MRQFGKILLVFAVLAVCAVAIGYVGMDVMGRAMKMAPAQTTAQEYDAAKSGAPLKVVVRIDEMNGPSIFQGHLLSSISETEYRATDATVRAQIDPGVRFIMGGMSDLKKGEIAQFDGERDGQGVLHVHRIVVLSSYVHEVAS